MKKLVKIFLITVCLLAFSGILASAATIDSISTYLMMVQFDDYFSAKDSPTTFNSAGAEIIDEKTGGVSIAKTDLSLPGKGGFDLNITRRFNSSMPMDENGNLYYVTVGNSTSIYDPHESVKYAFRYFIDGQEDGEPIYIAYDHVTDMLNAENGTNQIKVAESFSTQRGYGLITEEYYSIGYDASNQIGLTFGKRFHIYSKLPEGDDITLVRDTSVGFGRIWINNIHSLEFTYEDVKTNAYSGGGWIYDVPMLTTTSRTLVEKDDDYRIYQQLLLYTDPATEKTVCIFLKYETSDGDIDLLDSDICYYWHNGRRWETIYATQYDFRFYTDSDDDMHLDITDYNGTKHSFVFINNTTAHIKSSTDRLGNTIAYGDSKLDNTITDTYGREIDIEDDGIYVNGQKVVNYEYVVENNSSADPNDYLYNDDEHYFKVSYNTGTEDEGTTIYKYKHNNLKWYTSAMDEDPFVMTNDLDHFIMESITLPTGAETHYNYDYIEQGAYLEWYTKKIATVVSRYDIVENRQVNKVDYEYSLSNYENKTATARYSGENSYSTTKKYDEHNNLVNETQVSTQPGNEYYINTVYTYDLSDMGNYVPVKAVTTTAETANSSSKNVITEEYTYDDYENVIKTVRDGIVVQSATYNEYNLPVSQYQFKGNTKYVGVENTISSNGKLITASKNAEHALTSGYPTIYYGTSYEYSACGDVTKTVSEGTTTNITYAYATYDETNPTANSLVKTYTVTNVPTIDGTNDEPTAQTITVTEVYDYLGRLVSTTDAKGGITQYEYDSHGNVVKTTNADGTFATADYDYINNTIVSTDETGRKVKYEYDGLGNFAKGYMYDGSAWKLVTEREYDSFSNLAQVRLFNDNGTLKGKVSYTYYADKKPSSEIVTEGASSVIGKKELKYYPYYSGKSMKETVVYSSSDDSAAIREYTDKYGYKTKDTVTFNGNTYTQSYTTDYMGNILSVKDFKANAEGLSNTTSYSYDVTNKVLTETTSAGTITNTYNNTTGLLTSTKDRRGNITTYTYDNMGRLTREKTGTKDTRYYYDINGNVAQTRYYTDSSNYNVTKNVYDSRNRLTDIITKPDENEIVTRYVYDGSGRLLKVAEGLSAVTDTIDPDQHRVTEYAYDAYGNMSKQTDPMGDFTEYRYNLLGVMVSQTDKNGTDTNYAYDIKGNLLQKAYTTANGETDSVTYTYDMAGNLTKMVDSLGTTEYNYDSIGNLLSEVTGNTSKAYTYDANGNRTSFVLTVDGIKQRDVEYEYDYADRLSGQTDGHTNTSYVYDADGNLIEETLRGDGSRYNLYKRIYYDYDPLNQPTFKKVTIGDNYWNYRMTYDYAGNLKSVQGYSTYTYDGMGRLISEKDNNDVVINYTYDKYNNMTSKSSGDTTVSYAYDKNNKLVSSTQTGADVTNNFNYYYDNNGNLITKTQSILKASTDAPSTSLGTTSPYLSTYQYDGWNRLTGATIGDTVASYAYKGDNLRQSKTVTDQNGTKTTNFIYDGMNIIYDNDGTVQNNYIRGLSGVSYMEDSAGGYDVYCTNQHGDVEMLTDYDGYSKQVYTYDAYGNQKEITTSNNPFRYCGEYYDEETGFIYLRNRYYDPTTARFITEDPIKDGLNWYAYCGGNPVALVDPLGLEDVWLRDWIESKGGSVTPNQYNFLGIKFGLKSISASLNGINITYTSQDYYIKNDLAYMDDGKLGKDFGINSNKTNSFAYSPSDNIIKFIKDYEGYSSTVYDANPGKGDWTIGWGHKTTQNASPITKQQAENLFKSDLDKMLNTTLIPFLKSNNIALSQNQFDAMLSFTYNFGEYTWEEPPIGYKTIRDFLIKGDYTEAATRKAFSMYMGSNQLPGLITRREQEINMFLNGVYDSSH